MLDRKLCFQRLQLTPATRGRVPGARKTRASTLQFIQLIIFLFFFWVGQSVSFSGDGEELKNFAILQVFQKHFLSKGKWPPRLAALAL